MLLAVSSSGARALELLAIAGAAFTVFAIVRVLLLLRANAPRELVLGWIGLMLAAGVAVFVVQRVAG